MEEVWTKVLLGGLFFCNRTLCTVTHDFDQRALWKLPEDAPEGLQLSAQLFHPLPQLVIIIGQLKDLLLGLSIAHLCLVPALPHCNVIPLPPHPVLITVLVHPFLGLASVL